MIKSPREGIFYLTCIVNWSKVFFKQHINNMFTLEIFSWNKGRKFASQVEHIRTTLRNGIYSNKEELELVQPLVLVILTIVKKLPKQWQEFFNEHFIYCEEATHSIVKDKCELTRLLRECVVSKKDIVHHIESSKSSLLHTRITSKSLKEGDVSSFNKHCGGVITLSVESINEEAVIFKVTFHCSKT